MRWVKVIVGRNVCNLFGTIAPSNPLLYTCIWLSISIKVHPLKYILKYLKSLYIPQVRNINIFCTINCQIIIFTSSSVIIISGGRPFKADIEGIINSSSHFKIDNSRRRWYIRSSWHSLTDVKSRPNSLTMKRRCWYGFLETNLTPTTIYKIKKILY